MGRCAESLGDITPQPTGVPVNPRPIFLSVTLFSALACVGSHAASALERKYLQTLDDWVARGAPMAELQDTVVSTCGKFVLLTTSTTERASLLTTARDEFDFRVDVCTKMMVHRVHPQKEFQDTVILNAVCRRSEVDAFKALCREARL